MSLRDGLKKKIEQVEAEHVVFSVIIGVLLFFNHISLAINEGWIGFLIIEAVLIPGYMVLFIADIFVPRDRKGLRGADNDDSNTINVRLIIPYGPSRLVKPERVDRLIKDILIAADEKNCNINLTTEFVHTDDY